MRAVVAGDARAAREAIAADFPVLDRLLLRWALWNSSRDAADLGEAARLLESLVANAPPEDRESMVERVPLHRDVADAARAAGIGWPQHGRR